MSAIELLEKAAGHLKDRAETYDKPDGERSIGATVAAFNAVTGDGLMNSEERGWLFMSILKWCAASRVITRQITMKTLRHTGIDGRGCL